MWCPLLVAAVAALHVHAPPKTHSATSRRALLAAAAPAAALLAANNPTNALAADEQKMRTSSDFNSLTDLTGQQSQNLGAGTISSRSRPVTGVVLLDDIATSGKESAPLVSAELVLDGGVAATCSFQSQWPLIRGMYYDVEARSKQGDSVFMQVASLPAGVDLASAPDAFFTNKIFSTEGRFGAYGAPTDIRVLKSSKAELVRKMELTFLTLAPGGAESPRRAQMVAIQPTGSSDVIMLVGGSSASRWASAEPAIRSAIDSFSVLRVRPTKLSRKRSSDYRFEQQGGLWDQQAAGTDL